MDRAGRDYPPLAVTWTARPSAICRASCKPLAPNWFDHLAAWIKGERNHPSIMLWSVENEINFINARNMGQLDIWEPILTQAWEVVQEGRSHAADDDRRRRRHPRQHAADPRRPLPHQAFWNYPQLAYEANATSPCGTWTWDQKRPKFIGEELFAAGINPAYAYFGGEAGLSRQGRQPPGGGQGHAGHLPGLPLVRHCGLRLLPVAERRRRQPVQRLGAPRGARPPVGLDVRLPARRPLAPSAFSTARASPIRFPLPGP